MRNLHRCRIRVKHWLSNSGPPAGAKPSTKKPFKEASACSFLFDSTIADALYCLATRPAKHFTAQRHGRQACMQAKVTNRLFSTVTSVQQGRLFSTCLSDCTEVTSLTGCSALVGEETGQAVQHLPV